MKHLSYTPQVGARDESFDGWQPEVRAAVRQSQRQDKIAHIQVRTGLEAEAVGEAFRSIDWIDVEDEVRNGDVIERWGIDDKGRPWRVHVDVPEDAE